MKLNKFVLIGAACFTLAFLGLRWQWIWTGIGPPIPVPYAAASLVIQHCQLTSQLAAP